MEKDKKQSLGEDVSQLNSDKACSRSEPQEPEDRSSLQRKDGDTKVSTMDRHSDEGITTKVLDIQIRPAKDKYVLFREKAVKECEEYYPNCDKKTYRVAPTIVKHKRVVKKTETENTKPDEDSSILKIENAENAKGKDAESLILDAVENLKHIHGEQPMFIISNYSFEHYFNGLKRELYPKKAGEHDILLLHLQHGVVFIQVKAVEECKPEATKQQRDNRNKMIRVRVKEGLIQLDKDVEMFKHTMDDLHLNIPITKVLALPNISKKYLSTLTTSLKLLQDELGENALDLCLFRDQININKNNENEGKELLLEWWKRTISTKPGFRDADEYKQVIGRYVGLMSTVKMRTSGAVVAEEGYQNMRIILTPEQKQSPGEDVSQLISDNACSRSEPEEPEDICSLQRKNGNTQEQPPFRDDSQLVSDETYPTSTEIESEYRRSVLNKVEDEQVPDMLKESMNAQNSKGNHAVSLKLDEREDLKHIHDEEHSMIIISNYAYENDWSPRTDSAHLKKAGDNANKTIRKHVDRGVKMFDYIMKYLDLDLPITKVLALPNVRKTYISTLTTSMKLVFVFRVQISIKKKYENEGAKRLLECWKHNLSMKPGFCEADEYKQVIEQYAALVSTVKMKLLTHLAACVKAVMTEVKKKTWSIISQMTRNLQDFITPYLLMRAILLYFLILYITVGKTTSSGGWHEYTSLTSVSR